MTDAKPHIETHLKRDLTGEARAAELLQRQATAILKAVIFNGVPHNENGLHGVMVPLGELREVDEINQNFDISMAVDPEGCLILQLFPVPAQPLVPSQKARFSAYDDVTNLHLRRD